MATRFLLRTCAGQDISEPDDRASNPVGSGFEPRAPHDSELVRYCLVQGARVRFAMKPATLADLGVLADPGALFNLIVGLPVEMLGAALATQTPCGEFCSIAIAMASEVRPPGTVTATDVAGYVILALPLRLKSVGPRK